jgi:hypothetical protein
MVLSRIPRNSRSIKFSIPKTNLMKTQRGVPKQTNPSQKIWTFIENKKVRQLSWFSYKTPKSRNALASLNTWIWRLKFGLRAQNESYYMLFIVIFGSATRGSPYYLFILFFDCALIRIMFYVFILYWWNSKGAITILWNFEKNEKNL